MCFLSVSIMVHALPCTSLDAPDWVTGYRKASQMINATEVHRVYEDSPNRYWSVIKRRVSDSPLSALGIAAGAGFLAYGLLKPKPQPQNLVSRAAGLIRGRRMRSGAERTFKAVVGSLALRYLSRKVNSSLRWR